MREVKNCLSCKNASPLSEPGMVFCMSQEIPNQCIVIDRGKCILAINNERVTNCPSHQPEGGVAP